MRTYDENDARDREEASKLGAYPWQLEALKYNPEYVYWGPGEDYMDSGNKENGWRSSVIHETWKAFGPWALDELNECVNFYFHINRDSEECPSCGGNGYHPDAQEVVNSFYPHMNSEGIHWNDKITQDEVEALVAAGRLGDFTRGKPEGYVPTAEEVNASERHRRGLGHDAINRWILTEARLKRMGLPKTCPTCNADGSVFISDTPKLGVTLWFLHPRKGASRGVRIEQIEEYEVSDVLLFLLEAKRRNNDRFGGIA